MSDDDKHPSSIGFSSASNWTEVKRLRKDFGLSQANVADLLQIDQTRISRYESQGKHVSPEERSGLLTVEAMLADQPLKGAIKRLKNAQRLIHAVQDGGGTILGAIFDITLPIRVKRAILKALLREEDVYLTSDPRTEEKAQAAIATGPIGQRIAVFTRRIRQAVTDERWEDILLMAPPILDSIPNEPSVRALVVSIRHNYGLAVQMHEHNYPKARAIFDEVAQDPAADARDKAIAVYQKGYTWIEELIFPGASLSDIRKTAHDVESHLISAVEIYSENVIPGQALLHLADKLLELGDEIWAKELVTRAGEIFKNGDIQPIMDKIQTLDDARKRWPNLMRKRGWLRPVLKWLYE